MTDKSKYKLIVLACLYNSIIVASAFYVTMAHFDTYHLILSAIYSGIIGGLSLIAGHLLGEKK